MLLARYVQSLGVPRVGVVFDRSPIGRRYAAFFESECETLGVDVAARVPIGPLADDASERSGVRCALPVPTRSCTWDSVWWAPRSAEHGPTPAGTHRRP